MSKEVNHWRIVEDVSPDLSGSPDKRVRDMYERLKEAHRSQFFAKFGVEPSIPFEKINVNCQRLFDISVEHGRDYEEFEFDFDKNSLFCKWASM